MKFAKAILDVPRKSKLMQLCLVSLVLLLLTLYCNIGNTAKIPGLNKRHQDIQKDVNDKVLVMQTKETFSVLDSDVNKEASVEEEQPVNVMITFTKVEHNTNLEAKFRTTVQSLLRFASAKINLYILGDVHSWNISKGILLEVAESQNYAVLHLDIESLTKQVHEELSMMQKYFSEKTGEYYNDVLFVISAVIHKILPNLHRVIMLDCDLKFNADIKELFKRFELFTETNIMGIARDAQPVYRHNFHMYINKNKGTRVGAPPPDGLTGFNSGVLLLDLDKMRKSGVYNSLLSAESVKRLTKKYMFKGKLGDQDFYSLISVEHEKLFHVLPCNWNRQVCTWWKDHGYAEIFDQYFNCEGRINIYHGNCNSPIPKLDWES